MADNYHRAKFKAPQKSGVCRRCKKEYKIDDLLYYIDGCNYAITNNSKPICVNCYPSKNKTNTMTKYKELNKLMLSMGFKWENNQFENSKVGVKIINDSYYSIEFFEIEGFMHSKDLNIFWLIGVFTFHNIAEYKHIDSYN